MHSCIQNLSGSRNPSDFFLLAQPDVIHENNKYEVKIICNAGGDECLCNAPEGNNGELEGELHNELEDFKR